MTNHPRTDALDQYVADVLDGTVVAGSWVRLACERHLRDLEHGRERGLEFDRKASEKALRFFEFLRLSEGEFDGEVFKLMPWQAFIVGSLFGWKGPDGFRRFRTAYIEVGKGNGKSPMAAAIGLYGLVADDEPGAEIYAAATNRDQARILFEDAQHMVEGSDDLAELGLVSLVNVINAPDSHGTYKPISAQARSLDGKRVHIALIDELHEHPTSLVVDKMRLGTKNRRQALIFEITNSGHDRTSVCWEHHQYSTQILEGVVEVDSWFAYVCALDEGDDWRDESVWIKANPGLGTIISLKYLRETVQEAEGIASKQNLTRRLNFCEWTEGAERWLDMADWDAARTAIDPESLLGRSCYAGLDLAKVRDITSLCLLFPPADAGEPWRALWWHWVPEDDIGRRSREDKVPYDAWAREGHLLTTPGNTTDFDFIHVEVVRLAGLYDILEVPIDRTFAGELKHKLTDSGLDVVEFGQGFLDMGPPVDEIERLIVGHEFAHDGDPVLRWMASNAVIVEDAAGNHKIDKGKSSEKVDGLIALAMALGRAMAAEPGSDGGTNFYAFDDEEGDDDD